jgi:hypothetical protein
MDEPNRRNRWLRHCGFIAGLLAPLLLYAGAYWATCFRDRHAIRPGSGAVLLWGGSNGEPFYRLPFIRSERIDETLFQVFAPAHAVDRMIRPKYWEVKP